MPNDIYDQLNGWLYSGGTQVSGSDAQQLTSVQGPTGGGSIQQVGPLIRLDANQGILVGPSVNPYYGDPIIDPKTPFKLDTEGNITSVRMIRLTSADEAQSTDLTGFSTVAYIKSEDTGNVIILNSGNGQTGDLMTEFQFQETSVFRVHSSQDTLWGNRNTATDGAACNMFDVVLPNNGYASLLLDWSIVVLKGASTDRQVMTGRTLVSAVRSNAGTLTSTVTDVSTNTAVTSGTLTGAWAVVDGTTKITLTLTPNTDLAASLNIFCSSNIHSLIPMSVANGLNGNVTPL